MTLQGHQRLQVSWTLVGLDQDQGPGSRVQFSVCQAVFPQCALPRLQLSHTITDGSDEINNGRGQPLQQANDEWVWC